MLAIKRRARWLSWAALFVLACLSLLTMLQILAFTRFTEGNPEVWATILPMPFYLYAMFSVWRGLVHIAGDEGFAPIMSQLLRHSGIALFIGGLVEVFGQNLFTTAVIGRAIHAIDVTAVTIGVIGVGLYAISMLYDEASAAHTELDEFV